MEKNTVLKWTGLRAPDWVQAAWVKTGLWCLLEVVMAALLSRGVMLGGYAPLGVAWVTATAASVPEKKRLRVYAALLGAALGYCVESRVDGLRYAAASALACAVVMIFREVRQALFAPLSAMGVMAAVGIVKLLTGPGGWEKAVLLACEAVLAGSAAYFYGIARQRPLTQSVTVGGRLGAWELWRESRASPALVRAAFAVTAASAVASLGLYAPLWGIRLGCLASLMAVLACTQAGATSAGAAGLLLGAALDLCAGEILPRGYINAGLTTNGAVFAAVYGFLGLFAGMYRQRGPFAVALALVLGNAAALPWLFEGSAAPLFEGFAASVLYLTMHRPLSRGAAALFPRRGVAPGEGFMGPVPRGAHERVSDDDAGAVWPRAGSEAGTRKVSEDEQSVDGAVGLQKVSGQMEADGRRKASEREALEEALEDRVEALRMAFAALRSAVAPREAPPQSAQENPGAIFTFAADRCCRSCSMRDQCWNREYQGTRSAFNDATPAIMRRRSAVVTDFPPYFAARCVRLPELVASINDAMAAMRYQQRFRRRVREDNRLLCAQYDGMVQVLEELSEACPSPAPEKYRAIVGTAVQRKDGEEVCGDTCRTFKTVDGRVFMLISDGMGSGERAGEQSAMLARLLERFLIAGVAPATVLRLVCPAFALRWDGDAVASIDLCEVDLCTGEGTFYKCGAASSWLLRPGAAPRRIGGGTLPAGAAPADLAEAERVKVALQPGDRLVMVSDGVEGVPLAPSGEKSPGEIAEGILREASEGGCRDDMTVVAMELRRL